MDFISQADVIKRIGAEQESKNIVSDLVFADTANMAPYVNGGWMQIEGESILSRKPKDRGVSMIFQSYAMSVKTFIRW